MATEGNLSEKSEAPSLQPDLSFSKMGTGIIEEGGEAAEVDVHAEKTKAFPSENKGPKVSGGFTCCVPLCFNNSKRNRNLKFYRFPSGSQPDKIQLRKKWLSLISRQRFDPTAGHRVCSEHFPDGQKTYMNNLPLIVPKSTRLSIPKPRTTTKARNRDHATVFHKSERRNDAPEVDEVETDSDELASLRAEIQSMKMKHEGEMKRIQDEVNSLRLERDCLKAKNLKNSLSVTALKDNEKMFYFYTGIKDYETFKILFDSFGTAAETLIYSDSQTNPQNVTETAKKHGPKRSLSAEQEFFLVLVRLRCGLLEKDIAFRAGISVSHFSRICITWIDFLHSRFRALPIWATRETVDKTMPKSFKDTYPTTRVILDATEIFIEMPSSLRSQSESYSNYKHHNTAKGLVGIAPSGAITFVSDLYAGRCSDKAITKDSGLYDLLEEGDSIMADKGFTIQDDLPPNTCLNIPPFLGAKASLTVEEETETRRIASVRVHVERAIRRIKTFKILQSVFPIRMAADMNKIWIVCAYLTNLLPPLIATN